MIQKTETSNTRKFKAIFLKHNKAHKLLVNLRFNNKESTNTQKQKCKEEIA